jgi:hypothetical protein
MRSYGEKRRINGGDSYGTWKDGVQITPERINGNRLTYDHLKGEWK